VAGAAEMHYRRFVSYNVLGGVLWVFSTTLLGYFLGTAIPNISQYIHWVIAVVILLSLLPPAIEIWREKKRSDKRAALAAKPLKEDR
jgi:membrane-associated protein